MRSLIALAVLALLAPVANPDTASCRVSTRPTDWSEVRMMRPLTDPTPITTLTVDVCVYFEQTVGFEQVNELNPFGAQWYVLNMGIVVDASFDPNFAPGFEVAPSTVVMLNDVLGSVGAYDGVIDFSGTGGQSIFQSNQVLVAAKLAVTDDSYFRQPWPMYVRTRTLMFTQGSNAGAAVFSSTANAGLGIVIEYVP